MDDAHKFTGQYPAAEVLRKMIRTDTQNPPGNEAVLVSYIAGRLRERYGALRQKVIYHDGGSRASLIVRIAGKKAEDAVAFLGHLDTVPAGNADGWSYPPLDGVLTEGRYLYGRGANDMKSGLVSMLIVLEYCLETHLVPDNDLFFVFTADEECGGRGIADVKKSCILDHVNRIFVAEPTGGKLGITEKGSLWIELVANGRQAHGASPEKGINPIEFLSRYIYDWKNRILKGRDGKMRHISVSTTIFKGGEKSNVIPATATAVLDIRTRSEEQHKIILETLAAAALEMKKEAGITIRYKILAERIPLRMEKDSTFVRQTAQAVRRLGREPVYTDIPYYTDLAILLKEKKTDFIILGPGNEEDMHTVNEKTDVSKIKELADIYLEYLKICHENNVWQ